MVVNGRDLKETRNSFKKWPLNLLWPLNKSIMEIENITKTATFKSFLHLSYKITSFTSITSSCNYFFCDSAF